MDRPLGSQRIGLLVLALLVARNSHEMLQASRAVAGNPSVVPALTRAMELKLSRMG